MLRVQNEEPDLGLCSVWAVALPGCVAGLLSQFSRPCIPCVTARYGEALSSVTLSVPRLLSALLSYLLRGNQICDP